MQPVRLKRSSPAEPGLRRVRAGRTWRLQDQDGRPVSAEDRARITSLAIPPAWREVWICPDANGHLQATGLDDAGRRQYLYHPQWHERRASDKFAHLEDFAAALPGIRKQASADLRARSLTRERVLASTVRLLDQGFFRVGSESYATANGTIGLATLRPKDVAVKGASTLAFCYRGKGSLLIEQDVRDPAVVRVFDELIARCPRQTLPLLGFEDETGWHRLRSTDINAYLKAASDQPEISAKDFRTWSATVIAARALRAAGTAQRTKAEMKAVHNEAIREAADHLGNTLAVCRRSYVDPRVLRAHEKGLTIRTEDERAVLRLLRAQR